MLLKWRVTELFRLYLNVALLPFPSFVCCCLELGKTGFLPACSLLPRFRAASVCPCTCSLQLQAASAEAICTRPSSRLLGPLWLCLDSFPCRIFLAALAISALVHCSSHQHLLLSQHTPLLTPLESLCACCSGVLSGSFRRHSFSALFQVLSPKLLSIHIMGAEMYLCPTHLKCLQHLPRLFTGGGPA